MGQTRRSKQQGRGSNGWGVFGIHRLLTEMTFNCGVHGRQTIAGLMSGQRLRRWPTSNQQWVNVTCEPGRTRPEDISSHKLRTQHEIGIMHLVDLNSPCQIPNSYNDTHVLQRTVHRVLVHHRQHKILKH